jgi:lipopolysaccharide export system protein LptC
MRLLTLSVAGVLVAAVAAAARAQSTSSSSDVTELPVGQIYTDPSYPFFDATGQLKFTLTAKKAKGITVNHAEMTDLKIDLYTNGKPTTTITSPDADIYVADKKMRTRHTVKITRADSISTSQFCNFDLAAKQYTLRDHVKVVLLHFDMKTAAPGQSGGPMGVAPAAASGLPLHAAPSSTPAAGNDSLLESPGSYSSTNNAPLPH